MIKRSRLDVRAQFKLVDSIAAEIDKNMNNPEVEDAVAKLINDKETFYKIARYSGVSVEIISDQLNLQKVQVESLEEDIEALYRNMIIQSKRFEELMRESQRPKKM